MSQRVEPCSPVIRYPMFFISISLFNRARQRPAAGHNYTQQLIQGETMTGVAEAHFAAGLSKGEVEDDEEHFKALPKTENKTSGGTSDNTVEETWLVSLYSTL